MVKPILLQYNVYHSRKRKRTLFFLKMFPDSAANLFAQILRKQLSQRKEIKIKNLNEGFAKIEVTFLTNRFWHQTRFWNMICFYKSHVSQISVHRWCELITMERVQKKNLTAVCGFSSKALVGLLVRVGRENCFSFPSFNVFTRQVHLKAI